MGLKHNSILEETSAVLFSIGKLPGRDFVMALVSAVGELEMILKIDYEEGKRLILMFFSAE